MRTADGGWAVDFIGRVDDPNEDWDEVRPDSVDAPVAWLSVSCNIISLTGAVFRFGPSADATLAR